MTDEELRYRIERVTERMAGADDTNEVVVSVALMRELFGRMEQMQAKLDAVPVLSPDWDNAPEWAQWWAVDVNASAYWYENKPEPSGNDIWSASGDHEMDDFDKYDWGWRNTLQERPQVQP